jgi:23S rRNA (uracil1939-C5)-methyltransferase
MRIRAPMQIMGHDPGLRRTMRSMNVPELLDVPVTDLALGGKAIARHQGRVVFVDRGLPGDRIQARPFRIRRRYIEAGLESILEPSPDRVPAPCPHVDRCGGCRFQELDYPVQLRIKERQVREALEHLGRFEDPPVATIVAAPRTFAYRNKMEFSFCPDAAGAPLLGLHERGTFDRVFEVETCLLPSPLTLEIVRLTQQFARDQSWSAYHPRRHTGVVRFLTVRHLGHTDQCGVHLVAASDAIPGLDLWARAVVGLGPAVRTVSLLLHRGRANIAAGEEERLLVGDGVILERLLGLEFEASSGTFLQTNSAQAERLYAAALEAAELEPEDVVLDLYCGAGTLSLAFARASRHVVGVETSAEAVAAARRNATRNRIATARFVEGDARRVMREWARGERPDPPAPTVVVVDPPRAGLHPRVVARVAERKPRRVVYVSCNPATLARDLALFVEAGYRLVGVRPFDMFPHTPHIECVAALERTARAPS